MFLNTLVTVLHIALWSRVESVGLFDLNNGYKILKKELEIFALPTSKIQTRWIEQPLDHFDSNEKRLWLMRYYERVDLWKPNGPIYIFIGGEGEAHPGYLRGGMVYDLANETNGAIFMSEHRYYGKSMPLRNKGVESFKYLSSKQALADLAKLIKRIKAIPLFINSKVVVIGGSYAGNLAAWMELLYPDIVDAALASSAPVLAKKNFYEYLETVSDVYEQYGTPECYEYIEETFKRYDTLLKSSSGIEQLKKEEKICESSNMRKPENQQLFIYGQTGYFMVNAQYGRVETVKSHCEKLLKQKSNNSMRHSEMLPWFDDMKSYDFWDRKERCYNVDFDLIIEEIRDGNDWITSWAYQMCSEFSYAKSTSSDNQPFTKNIPITTFYQICVECFGKDFDERNIELAVNNTNEFYGGLKPNVRNVVFVNGDMDPWHRLGITEDVSYDAPAKVIPRSSHCLDLLPNKKHDPEELTETRRYIKYLIKTWIGIEECDRSIMECKNDIMRY